ncbi:porin [Echinicola sp. CAU 1574]|uniref:Porin n=1 Tax=Echinicola arenosa TaxID=2774144 RepID=A0ABR9AQ57_9BACT|nr:porin [Echinicola arenosa]MBD8490918.1 porin [Echinicola arenosa]
MKIKLVFIFLILCSGFNLGAQTRNDSLTLSFKPYSSFRGHFSLFNGELEIQQNASRIGFEIALSKENSTFFAGSELSLNMFRGDQQFNLDASTSGGFIDIDSYQVNQVFGTRLGYLGVKFKRGGTIMVGKQWSVYYDVTGYTDKFNVFGGGGTATYTSGTDGGTTGTGRADQAITYRNQFGKLHLGLQLQAENANNNHIIDGYGISGQLELIKGLKIGGTYYRVLIQDTLRKNTIGFDKNPEYMAFGINYVNNKWDLGLVYSDQSNGDLRRNYIGNDIAAIVFDASGIEFYSKYTFQEFSIIAGFNQYKPKILNLPLSNGFKTDYYILGFEYKPLKHAYFYSEFRINSNNNRDHLGEKSVNVYTAGLRIDLERSFNRIIMTSK